jgi:hypothetical protein
VVEPQLQASVSYRLSSSRSHRPRKRLITNDRYSGHNSRRYCKGCTYAKSAGGKKHGKVSEEPGAKSDQNTSSFIR